MLLGACNRDYKPNISPPTEEVKTTQVINEVQPRLEKTLNQQLEEVFQGSTPLDQKVSKALTIHEEAERQARSSLNQSAKDIVFLEEKALPVIFAVEKTTIEKTIQLMENKFNKIQTELNEHLLALNNMVQNSYPLLKVEMPPLALIALKVQTLQEYQEDNIENPVQEALTTKYEPHELAIVQKPKPVALKDIPYKFKSPEGEFLTQIQALYLKIYNAHPYHEQGRVARVLALFSLEVADEKTMVEEQETTTEEQETTTEEQETTTTQETKLAQEQQQEELQHLFYQISQALMLNIDDSLFEESTLSNKESRRKWGQSIYEILSGKHFLTGRTLTDNERAVRILDSAYVVFKQNNWTTLTPLIEVGKEIRFLKDHFAENHPITKDK